MSGETIDGRNQETTHNTSGLSYGHRIEAGGNYLTFFLGKEEYGLRILKVQEIIGLLPITPLPGTPNFILGVINLRGKIIPVIDLRLKFGLKATEQTEESCIIVARTQGFEMGLVVDKVSEVLNIADADIEEAPSFGPEVNTAFLIGIGKAGDRVKLLLDIDRVMANRDFESLESSQTEDLASLQAPRIAGLQD